MTDFCDKHWRAYGAIRLNGYDACFQEEVRPIQESANDAARDVIDDLKTEVGPECLRALRRVELTFAPNDFELPDDALKRLGDVSERVEIMSRSIAAIPGARPSSRRPAICHTRCINTPSASASSSTVMRGRCSIRRSGSRSRGPSA